MATDPETGYLALAAAGVAVVTDWRSGKIYNAQTVPLLLMAPVWHLVRHGWAGVAESLLGAGLVAAVLLGLAVTLGPGLGGGDMKLLLALGALVGWPLAGWLCLYVGAAGLLGAPVLWLREIGRVGGIDRSAGSGSRARSVGSPAFPYAFCIFFGTALTVWLGPL